MTSPIESANTPEDTAARTRPRIGRAPGSKNAAPQARAVRTRDAIIAVAARHFDTDGYGHASMNTIVHTENSPKARCTTTFHPKKGSATNSSRTGSEPSTKPSLTQRPVRAVQQQSN